MASRAPLQCTQIIYKESLRVCEKCKICMISFGLSARSNPNFTWKPLLKTTHEIPKKEEEILNETQTEREFRRDTNINPL